MADARFGDVPGDHLGSCQTIHDVERFPDSSLAERRIEAELDIEPADLVQRSKGACPVRRIEALVFAEPPRSRPPVNAGDRMSCDLEHRAIEMLIFVL